MNDKNIGYDNLVDDLGLLLKEAASFRFDDLHENSYAFPKKTLLNRLEEIVSKAKSGKYDN